MQVRTGSTGTVTVTGRTADGVTLTGSTSLYKDAGGNVSVPMFASMYGVYPYAGQVAGTLTLTPLALAKVSGDLEWRKPNVTAWTGTLKGVYKAGAVVSYQVAEDADGLSYTGFAPATFAGDFSLDELWYETAFVCSAWDTTGLYAFKTTATTVGLANYSGNVMNKSVVTQGLLGLSFSKTGGTLNLNYIQSGKVAYGYGLIFPGRRVAGHVVVDDTTGSGRFTALGPWAIGLGKKRDENDRFRKTEKTLAD
jgi:hypothetical protein